MFIAVHVAKCIALHLKVLNFVPLSHSSYYLVSAFWPCCLLPVFYNIVICALLIFILKSLVKILRKLSPKMDLQGFLKKPFSALSRCYPGPFSWGSFSVHHIVSFLILIFFSLTGSFPGRHSIKCFSKVRIDEIYWISVLRKYPIKKSYCTSLAWRTFANLCYILFCFLFILCPQLVISSKFVLKLIIVNITFPSSLPTSFRFAIVIFQ